MIGRAAQGRPWIFHELELFRSSGKKIASLTKQKLRDIILDHLNELHRFYGDSTGVRVARKHITWYCKNIVNADEYRHRVVRVEKASEQIGLTIEYFDRPDVEISMAA